MFFSVPPFFVIQIMRSHLWPVYSKLLLMSDTNTIPRKNLARVYMKKTFANDRWQHLSGDHTVRGGATPPVNIPEVRTFVNVAPSVLTAVPVLEHSEDSQYKVPILEADD